MTNYQSTLWLTVLVATNFEVNRILHTCTDLTLLPFKRASREGETVRRLIIVKKTRRRLECNEASNVSDC